jgi:O-antigen ligase
MAAAAPALSGPSYRSRVRDSAESLWQSTRLRQVATVAGLIAFACLWGAAVAFSAVGAALLAVSFVACLLCLRDFRVGVMILIVIMPVSSSTLFPHAMFGITGLNPLNLLLIATLAVFFMRSAGTPALKGFLPRPLFWLYMIPITVAAIIGMEHVQEIPRILRASEMIFFDNKVGYFRDMLFKPFTLVLYAALVGAAVAWSERPERFVIPMLVSVFVMAAMAIAFVLSSGASLSQLAGTYARHFLSTIGLHANDLGRLYAIAFALLLFVWDRSERWGLKFVLVLAMGLVMIALLLTFSRGAFFGFAVVCVLYLALRRSLKTMLLAAVLIPPALLLAPGALWSRLQMGVGQGLNEITAGRVDEIWIPLMPEALATPPWGHGLGSVMWAKAMRFDEMFTVTHPHNAYLQLYMDLGIIGAVLVLAFWIYTMVSFWRLTREDRLRPEMQGFFEGAAVGLVASLVTGIAGSSLLPQPEHCYLWLAIGMMWGVKKHLARIPAPLAAAPVQAPRASASRLQPHAFTGAL